MRRTLLAAVLVAVAVTCFSGCAYLGNRGNDALDIFDIGFTVTKQPHFAVYCGVQSLITIGYADLDGYLLGIGHRRAGWLKMSYHSAGFLLEGTEHWRYAYPGEDIDLAQGPPRGVGLGLLYGAYPQRPIAFFSCPKLVHVGWIGLDINCQIGQLVDFVLGWTTLDIGGDDVYPDTIEPASQPRQAASKS